MPQSLADNLYASDAYLDKHPTLFREHTAWKLSFIKSMLDRLMAAESELPGRLRLLDVGGGAGILLHETARYLSERHGREVVKYALDLSPGMLEEQRRNNPDLCQALQQDITHTTLPDRSIELTLLIDVLEHLPEPGAALRELARVSRYVVLKVPLENHLVHHVSNFLNKGQTRRAHAASLGHINFYTAGGLRRQIETHLGTILACTYCNCPAFTLQHESHRLTPRLRRITRLAARLHRLSHAAAALFYTDALVLLVQCRP